MGQSGGIIEPVAFKTVLPRVVIDRLRRLAASEHRKINATLELIINEACREAGLLTDDEEGGYVSRGAST